MMTATGPDRRRARTGSRPVPGALDTSQVGACQDSHAFGAGRYVLSPAGKKVAK
jgi:hypothetical protein